jgi:hypothetical protein
MFELLSELVQLKEEQETIKIYPIVESVDTLLRNLTAKIKSKPENFLEHIDIEQLAPQLAALMILGKRDNRESFDDFSQLDPEKKVSQKFYFFLRDIDEQHADRLFDEGITANKFLLYIGNTHAKSLTEEWKTILEKAKTGDQAAIEKVKQAFTKLNEHYAVVYKKLTDAFYDKQGEHAFGSSQSGPTASSIDTALNGIDTEI